MSNPPAADAGAARRRAGRLVASVRSRRPSAIGSIRWSMPRIHAGRSHRSRAKSSAAMTTAAAPSVIGGQSDRAQRVDDRLLAEVARRCCGPTPAAALGLSSAAFRLRVATSAIAASVDRARLERGAGLQGGEADGVGPQRRHVVRVELAGQHLVDRSRRRLPVAVDEGAVDLAELELDPRLVQGEGAVHLDVALLDRRPRSDTVEGHHEAEGRRRRGSRSSPSR